MTGPIALTRTISNSFDETRMNAQYIGDLNNYGTFDIALSGTLAFQDKGDYYNFRVTSSNTNILLTTVQQTASGKSGSSSSSSSGSTSSTGSNTAPATTSPTSLTKLVNSGQLRYQLYTQTGQLIADSDPNAGQAYTAYQKLTSETNIVLNAGTYTIKVSPGPNALAHTSYDYLFSIRAGSNPVAPNAPITSREEFQTTATPATANLNAATTGWIQTVLSPTSAAGSMFQTLDVYDGGASDVAPVSSNAPKVPLESDTLLGGVVNLSG
jgi:hypothetical protein